MRVFFDSNVLVSAFATRGLCADVLRLALAEHEVVTGEAVIAETCKALAQRIGLAEPLVAEVEHFLRSQNVAAEPAELPDVSIRDQQDLHMLASAIAGRAEVFVTGDRDFLEASREIPIRVVTPRGFWELLRQRKRGRG